MSSIHGRNQFPTGPFKNRLDAILKRLASAASVSGREAQTVDLVAVTKTVPVDIINEALAAGVTKLGENRVQEAAAKRDALRPSEKVEHHLIGALQTNKARKAVELFDVIQSVDRPRLAETLDRIAGEMGKIQRCFVEVKISDEESKSGVPLADASEFVRSFGKYPHLKLEGLMTIGALDASEEQTRAAFRRMKTFFDAHRDVLGQSPALSMGMSDDFEMAVEEGSTLVRIGRALFGERA
jgi:pyridoxal phosphate enzyme (YggS family)